MSIKRLDKSGQGRLWCFVAQSLLLSALAIAKFAFGASVDDSFIYCITGLWLFNLLQLFIPFTAVRTTDELIRSVEDRTNPDLPRERKAKSAASLDGSLEVGRVELIKGLGEQLKKSFGDHLTYVVMACSFALMMMGNHIRDNAYYYTTNSRLAQSLDIVGNAQILVGMACLAWGMWQPSE